jgi:murein DD-endopeptidase MepM/ murein hydrolase activator NlpD
MTMKKRNLIYAAGAASLLLLAISCPGCSGLTTGITKVADAISNPSAREVYAREFRDNEAAYTQWQNAYNSAVQDSITVTLPYGEKGKFIPESNAAYSYIFTLQEGEMLVAEVVKDSVNRVFVDVLEQDASGFRHLESTKLNESHIGFTPQSSGRYKIVIQPEIAAGSDFFISLDKKPMYAFPVSGKGNAAIGSFWGMERDGGKRSHEGIDIFAKKGTPVVAITDGTINYTGERGLGGKQVWLRDGLFGRSLYYAHLDEIKAVQGTRVKVGDTLGFVGNTGNARFTPPHLHFGIYTMGGAVNPLPYVYTTEKIAAKQYPKSFKASVLKAKSKANLRLGPAATAPVIGALGANDTITLLGQHKDWLHVKTASNLHAYLHKSLVKG